MVVGIKSFHLQADLTEVIEYVSQKRFVHI